MKNILLLLLLVCSFQISGFSQDKPEVETSEKKVIVIKKTIDENGEVIVDKQVIEGGDVEEILDDMDIEIDTDISHDGNVKKRYKMIMKDEDGQEKLIEWNGEGEMPEELKKHMDDENIFIHHLSDHPVGVYEIDVKKEVILGEGGDEKIKVIINRNGKEEVLEWEGEGEMPEEIRHKLDHHKVKVFGSDDVIEVEVDAHYHHLNKAFLGVHIEDSESGAKVIDVEEGSAASLSGINEGDIITAINNYPVSGIESLIEALKNFEPKDEVSISYIREGKESKVKSVLKERPVHSENIWIQKEDFDPDSELLFFDKKGNKKIVKKKVVIIKKDLEEGAEKEEAEEVENKLPAVRGKKLNLSEFNAFPNPTSDVINVSFEADKAPLIVQIFDMSGKQLYKNVDQNFDGYFNEDIDLSKYSQGNYVLYVIQNQRVFTHNIALN